MSVSNQDNKIVYASTGLDDYEIPFFFAVEDDVKVYVDDVLIESGYTVDGAGDEDGGTLSFTSGTPAADTVVTILRDVPLTQESSFSEGGPMEAATIENMFDKLTHMAQQISERVSRAIKLPLSSSGLDPQITGTVIPGALIEVNETGDGLKMGQSVAAYTAQLDAIKDDALAAQAAAEAAQSAAGVSATAAGASATAANGSAVAAAASAAAAAAELEDVLERLDDLEAPKTTNYIVGDEATNGSWRYRQDGTDLLKETRIAGVWTEKERTTQAD